MVQTEKNPPAMQETWVQSLGWEDPLEEGMATYSMGESPWTEEPGRLQSTGSQRVRHDWDTKHTHKWFKNQIGFLETLALADSFNSAKQNNEFISLFSKTLGFHCTGKEDKSLPLRIPATNNKCYYYTFIPIFTCVLALFLRPAACWKSIIISLVISSYSS